MGLMVHSLEELPQNASREFYIYLLDYGWHEPLGQALHQNFDRMAARASECGAVVLHGVGAHFQDEVLSWHHINGQPADELLPAILLTTVHPFHSRDESPRSTRRRHQRGIVDERMVLIPLRHHCRTSTDVAVLIDQLFADISEKRGLLSFRVAEEIQRGNRGAIVDALILQPNVSGIGVNIGAIVKYLKGLWTDRTRR